MASAPPPWAKSGLAAATAAEHLGCPANQVAGLDAVLAGGLVRGHGDHRLVVLGDAGKRDDDRRVLAELGADVHHGLAQRVERAEVADVLRSDLDTRRGRLRGRDELGHGRGPAGLRTWRPDGGRIP